MPVHNGDTTPEIRLKFREMMMQRSSIERAQMASQMFDDARALALASCPEGMNEIEIKRFLCTRFYAGEVDVESFMNALAARG